MTAKSRRLVEMVALSAGLGLVGVAAMTYLTWPANTLGNYLHHRRNREANIRALTMQIARQADPLERRFYQAWLAEEKNDVQAAIRGFHALRAETRPGTNLHLRSSLRLGLAYGLNNQPEQELATYQALMDQYPGPSRLSQATFYLRRGNRDRARAMLDEALTLDEKDGSLGSDRGLARSLRSGLGPATPDVTSVPR